MDHRKNNNDFDLKEGISEKDALEKLKLFGYNRINDKKKESVLLKFLRQFADFMVLVLMAATAISIIMGEITEAVTILVIIFLNALLGFVQEMRTEKALESLKNMAAPTAKVIRDGKLKEVNASLLVPGDHVIIDSGDRIPADAIIVEDSSLTIDESMLTGESIPVEKKSIKDIKHCKNSQKVYMGTTVAKGSGRIVVVGTGMDTEMGKIAVLIHNAEETQTPLQIRLETLGKYIVMACLAICFVVSITGIIRGEDIFKMLLSGISLAVAAVPEGLPAVVTIALAIGVQKMASSNAVVRRLPAVETLGCATYICSDKTGTLTQNKMTVKKIYSGRTSYDLVHDTRLQFNNITLHGRKINPDRDFGLKNILKAGVLCTNIKFADGYIMGDPTEAAIGSFAINTGIDYEKVNENNKRQREIPFDSERKLMSVICKTDENKVIMYTKGAPDILIEKCNSICIAGGQRQLNNNDKIRLLRENNKMADNALRVIAIAMKEVDKKNISNAKEEELTFLGLVGMIDPPRPEVKKAVRQCKKAGIKPVMITGDHKNTAAAIAREIRILDEGIVLTGKDLDSLSDSQLDDCIEKVSVFARVKPTHKIRIVKALKKKGQIVAMTGDGVNDAPAIKEADIGIAMGDCGTDVAREAAAMVLADDNFSSIISAVREGRVIYSNIRKFIRYLLSCNIGEVLTMFIGMLIGLPVPLLPVQILLINLATDGLPAIALGMEKGDNNIMDKPPRDPKENIFARGLARLILVRGTLIGLVTLISFVITNYYTQDIDTSRTVALATLVISQLIHVFECKCEDKGIFSINPLNNPFMLFSVLFSFAAIVCVIYIPQLQDLFKTTILGRSEWCIVIGLSFIIPVVNSIVQSVYKIYRYKDNIVESKINTEC